MKRPQFSNGGYMVGGAKYQQLKGSRAQVMNGTALATNYGSSGLRKKDLVMNKWGRIVSRRKHITGKKSGLKRLHAKGYFTKKGKFGVFKKGVKTKKRRSRSRRRSRSKSRGKRCRHTSGRKKGKFKKC